MKNLALALALVACIAPAAWGQGKTDNPPPATKLADFGAFELKKMVTPVLSDGAAQAAADQLDKHLAGQINPILASWKATAAPGGRRLTIEPALIEMHFVSAKIRSWGGQFAGGDSFVTVHLKLTDSASGALIAEPEFYQRTDMVNGGMAKGVADRNMLRLVARLAGEYLKQNHDAAVGGPTGRH